MAVEEIRAKHLRWIDITNANNIKDTEIQFLKRNFNFHPLNLQDAIAKGQRPKIDVQKDHFFLVMLYPIYYRKTGEVIPAEIDFFVGQNYIITVHDKKLPIVVNYFNHLKKAKNKREKDEFLTNNPIIVLHELLNKLNFHCFPMLDHISIDIHKAEKHIFRGKEHEMVGAILASRRNIVNFRKSMQAHKNILKKLEQANRQLKFFDPNKANIYFNNLIDQVKDIWDSLESFKESIEALQDTNESLISFHLNQIMKTFTSISVVIFVLTLVATLLGLGVPGTPLINWPLAFWFIILLEVIIAGLVFSFFKRRKWLK